MLEGDPGGRPAVRFVGELIGPGGQWSRAGRNSNFCDFEKIRIKKASGVTHKIRIPATRNFENSNEWII